MQLDVDSHLLYRKLATADAVVFNRHDHPSEHILFETGKDFLEHRIDVLDA